MKQDNGGIHEIHKIGGIFMRDSLSLGKIKGIQVEVNYSWLIIFTLITLTFATVYFPAALPAIPVPAYWALGAMIALLLFLSVFLHELAHSLVSIRYGLPVKKISLFIFGGLAYIEKDPDNPKTELLISAAGPLMSLFLYVCFTGVALILIRAGASPVVYIPLNYIGGVNYVLALFNLIPALPLDGGRILRGIIWYYKDDYNFATKVAASLGRVFSYFLILMGLLMIFKGLIINGIWLIFIGGFINQSAQSSYQYTTVQSLFKDLPIHRLMTPTVIAINYQETIKDVVQNYFYLYRHTCFPVIEDHKVLGIVTLDDIKKLPREKWEETNVFDLMQPLNENLTILIEGSSSDVFQKIMTNKVGRLLVFDEHKLVGIISKTDILNYINIHNQLY